METNDNNNAVARVQRPSSETNEMPATLTNSSIPHTCDVKELKSILKQSERDPSLLNFIRQANSNQRNRPHAYFAFPGTCGSVLAISPFQRWPTQNGWSFSTWFYIEPRACNSQPYLYCFKTSKTGLGYTAHFTGNCLVLTSMKVKDKGLQHCIAHEFPSHKWIHCAITYITKWRASEIKVYVNGQLKANIDMQWQVQTNENFDKCFIGGSAALGTTDVNCFCGQMSAIYMFNEGLTAAQICAIHRLGPSYMGQLKYSNESHVYLPAHIRKVLYEERLSSSIFCLFTPVAVDGGTLCLQSSPNLRTQGVNYFMSSPHAALIGQTKAIVTQTICSTLQSIGCARSLLPLLQVFSNKGDADACSTLIGFLCDLLECSPHWFANEIVQCHVFVIIASSLTKNSRKLMDEQKLEIFMNLTKSLISSSASTGIDSLLLKHLMDNILFNPTLWIYVEARLQIKLYSYLALEFLNGTTAATTTGPNNPTPSNSSATGGASFLGYAPAATAMTASAASTSRQQSSNNSTLKSGIAAQTSIDGVGVSASADNSASDATHISVAEHIFGEVRRVSTVLQLLHSLKYYYWMSDEKGYSVKARDMSLRPDRENLLTIRSYILMFIKELILKSNYIPHDELQGILNYLSTVEHDDNLLDVLKMLEDLMREQPSSLVPSFDSKQGIKVIFKLLTSQNEHIRIQSLKLLSMFSAKSTQKRKQDVMSPHNLFMLLCDILKRYTPMSLATYDALYDILVEGCGNNDRTVKSNEAQSDGDRNSQSRPATPHIENPMILKVIATLIIEADQQSINNPVDQIDIKTVFLNDLWNLIVNSRENRRIVLQMSVWQHWLINLITKEEAKSDAPTTTRDKVLAIFRVLLYHAIRYEYGGWRVWIDTLAIIHTKVSYDDFVDQLSRASFDTVMVSDEDLEDEEEDEDAMDNVYHHHHHHHHHHIDRTDSIDGPIKEHDNVMPDNEIVEMRNIVEEDTPNIEQDTIHQEQTTEDIECKESEVEVHSSTQSEEPIEADTKDNQKPADESQSQELEAPSSKAQAEQQVSAEDLNVQKLSLNDKRLDDRASPLKTISVDCDDLEEIELDSKADSKGPLSSNDDTGVLDGQATPNQVSPSHVTSISATIQPQCEPSTEFHDKVDDVDIAPSRSYRHELMGSAAKKHNVVSSSECQEGEQQGDESNQDTDQQESIIKDEDNDGHDDHQEDEDEEVDLGNSEPEGDADADADIECPSAQCRRGSNFQDYHNHSKKSHRTTHGQQAKASATPAFRIPEFKWSELLIKLLNDLMFSIECDLNSWRRQAHQMEASAAATSAQSSTRSTLKRQFSLTSHHQKPNTGSHPGAGQASSSSSSSTSAKVSQLDQILRNPDNQVYIVNIIHFVSQMCDNIIIAAGGLLPLLAEATGGTRVIFSSKSSISNSNTQTPSSSVQNVNVLTSEGVTMAQANSILYRLIGLVDMAVFAASHVNLAELEADKNTTTGGILRQCLRLACTVAVKNCLIIQTVQQKIASLGVGTAGSSFVEYQMSPSDFPRELFDNYHGCSIVSAAQLFDTHRSADESDLVADSDYSPHQSSAGPHFFLPFQTVPIKDCNKLLQEADINRIQTCVYRDIDTESRQSQFLALASLYFISVLMVSKYRDIIEPKRSDNRRPDQPEDVDIGAPAPNLVSMGSSSVSLSSSNVAKTIDSTGYSSMASSSPSSSMAEAMMLKSANQFDSIGSASTGSSSSISSASHNQAAISELLTRRLEATLAVVCPLLRDIMCDFCAYFSKTLLGSHGQDLVSREAARTFRRANTSAVELVMLLCSQEWQNTLQKNAGLAFIELINEGRILSHGMKDHIVRVAMEAEFILNRLRADDVSKHEQFGMSCMETQSARQHEESLINSLINSAKRRDYMVFARFCETLCLNKRNYKLDSWEDDDRRRRRFVLDPWDDDHQFELLGPTATNQSIEKQETSNDATSHQQDTNNNKRASNLDEQVQQVHVASARGVGFDAHDAPSAETSDDEPTSLSYCHGPQATGQSGPASANSTNASAAPSTTEPLDPHSPSWPDSDELGADAIECGVESASADFTGSVLFSSECSLVWNIYSIEGLIQVTANELYFEPNAAIAEVVETIKREKQQQYTMGSRSPVPPRMSEAQNDSDNNNSKTLRKLDLRVLRYCDFLTFNGKIALADIRAIFARRHLLQANALEIFVAQRTSVMFAFNDYDTVKRCVKYLPPVGVGVKYGIPQSRRASLMTPRQLFSASNMTQRWQRRELSNFQYLTFLNTIAGRTYQDLNQYPVFPWILTNYDSDTLDLTLPTNFRDLSKPVGALNTERRLEFIERYQSWDNPKVPAFHYGTHYSTAAFTLSWLSRLRGQFNAAYVALQDGKYEDESRLFLSLGDSWLGALVGGQQNVKELIPEFFYLPEIFDANFGLPSVELPRWATSPEHFIRQHRAALESELVSCQLHQWIDLIFGYKQRGPEAVRAINVFYYLTYEGNVNLASISDPALREAIETQIRHFGQTPSQLTCEPHPPRSSTMHVAPLMFTPIVEPIRQVVKFAFNSPIVQISPCVAHNSTAVRIAGVSSGASVGAASCAASLVGPSNIVTVSANHSCFIHKWCPTGPGNSPIRSGVPASGSTTTNSSSNSAATSATARGKAADQHASAGDICSKNNPLVMDPAATIGSDVTNAASANATGRHHQLLETYDVCTSVEIHSGGHRSSILTSTDDTSCDASTKGISKSQSVKWPTCHYIVTLDGRHILMGSFYDNSFRVFATDTGRLSQIIYGHRGPVTCMARSECNAVADFYVATGSYDCSVLLWTWNAKYAQIEGNGVSAVGNPLPKLTISGHESPVLSVLISAELGFIITASINMILIHTTNYAERLVQIDVRHVYVDSPRLQHNNDSETGTADVHPTSKSRKRNSPYQNLARPFMKQKTKASLEASMLGDLPCSDNNSITKDDHHDDNEGDSSCLDEAPLPFDSINDYSNSIVTLPEHTDDYYVTNVKLARELAFIICVAIPINGRHVDATSSKRTQQAEITKNDSPDAIATDNNNCCTASLETPVDVESEAVPNGNRAKRSADSDQLDTSEHSKTSAPIDPSLPLLLTYNIRGVLMRYTNFGLPVSTNRMQEHCLLLQTTRDGEHIILTDTPNTLVIMRTFDLTPVYKLNTMEIPNTLPTDQNRIRSLVLVDHKYVLAGLENGKLIVYAVDFNNI
ncbi:Neurobeachin, partial [Fragariocoptes setiger]